MKKSSWQQSYTWSDLRDGLLDAPSAVHVILITLVSLLKYGLGTDANWASGLDVARHLPDPSHIIEVHNGNAFLVNSPVDDIVAWILHATSTRSYLALNLILVVASYAVLYRLARVRHSREVRSALTITLLASAVVTNLFVWLGTYDPASILGAGLAALGTSRTTRVVGWTLFALNNPPQAALAAAAYAIVSLARYGRRSLRGHVVLAALGVGLGGAINWAIMASWSVSFFARASDAAHNNLTTLARSLESAAPLLLLSSLGVGWVLLGASPLRQRREVRILFVVALVATIVVPLIAGDQERVLALVMWPALLWVIAGVFEDIDNENARSHLTRTMPLALVLPMFVTWNGAILYPGMLSTVKLVRQMVFG